MLVRRTRAVAGRLRRRKAWGTLAPPREGQAVRRSLTVRPRLGALVLAAALLCAAGPAEARGGWLGVKVAGGKGARVESVAPGRPAQRAGLRAGDVIVRFAGKKVKSGASLRRLVARSKPGRATSLTFERGDIRFDYGVTLDAKPSRRVVRRLGPGLVVAEVHERRTESPEEVARGFVGGPAPPLSVAEWVRRPDTPDGTPEGQVRLLQFWATW